MLSLDNPLVEKGHPRNIPVKLLRKFHWLPFQPDVFMESNSENKF